MATIGDRDLKGGTLAALESIHKVLLKFGDLWIDNGPTVALVGVIAEVILMVRLRQVKHREGGDLGHDRRIPNTIVFESPNRIFSGFSLLFMMIENRGSILGPYICALAIQRRGVMDAEEHFQDRTEGEKAGIECDLNNFGVTGCPGADIQVGRIGDGSTSVPHFDIFNARQFIEDGVQAPEASAAECGDF